MKKVTLCLLILSLLVSCNLRKKSTIDFNKNNLLDFVIDSTLERYYLEDSTLNFMPNNWEGEVTTAEMAFKIAEPILIEAWGEKDIMRQKPFTINLIDNEIWIIEGNLQQSGTKIEDIVFGGSAYMEIRKSNGEILKSVYGE